MLRCQDGNSKIGRRLQAFRHSTLILHSSFGLGAKHRALMQHCNNHSESHSVEFTLPSQHDDTLALQKIAPLIHEIRGARVILDSDLARIYGVTLRTSERTGQTKC